MVLNAAVRVLVVLAFVNHHGFASRSAHDERDVPAGVRGQDVSSGSAWSFELCQPLASPNNFSGLLRVKVGDLHF